VPRQNPGFISENHAPELSGAPILIQETPHRLLNDVEAHKGAGKRSNKHDDWVQLAALDPKWLLPQIERI